jgi:hypothetical protein
MEAHVSVKLVSCIVYSAYLIHLIFVSFIFEREVDGFLIAEGAINQSADYYAHLSFLLCTRWKIVERSL